MANSNPQAVAFDNNYARRMADIAVSYYLTCKRFLQVWDGQNIVAVIPNDATVIADGADVDGRAPVTNGQVNILVANMRAFVTQFEAGASIILNQTLQVHVNATAGVN